MNNRFVQLATSTACPSDKRPCPNNFKAIINRSYIAVRVKCRAGGAHWLCACGQKPTHRTKVHRSHPELPKMRALIPQRSWNQGCRDLGGDPEARERSML